ncbi:5886_t:CDS:2 [Paraglomus brasilianum]|uniref:5886_t:CDS:1 n=1 Tax=Paraglomus brasilianum TaxID=144538 RepID=A0A9N8W1S5_9GLOM|nr:5886_t:CDS:2 [Paraglomus brasilianum]
MPTTQVYSTSPTSYTFPTLDLSQTSNLSLEDYRYIKDRRFYVGDNIPYFLPNDEEEIERWHMLHYLTRYTWRSNFSAPVEESLFVKGTRILDVGCGSGTWILEMANLYPQSTFIGVDIASIFPPDSTKPHNAGFLQCNILNGLPFPGDTFDFVHIRFMNLGLTERQWEDLVIPELVRVVKTGGWIEIMELSNTWENAGESTEKLFEANDALFASRNLSPNIEQNLEQCLKSSDKLTDICKEERSTAVGAWGGALGERMSQNIRRYAKSCIPALSEILHTNLEEYEATLENSLREVDENKNSVRSYRIYFLAAKRKLDLFYQTT